MSVTKMTAATLFLFLARVGLSQPLPKAASHLRDTVIDAPVQGADISKIIDTLRKASGRPRGEFETTAEFTARTSVIPESLSKPMVFPLVLGSGSFLRYDADSSRLTIFLGSIIASDGDTYFTSFPLKRIVTPYASYAASNAFGASKTITKSHIKEQGIATQGISKIWNVEMAPDVAATVKPFSCIAITGSINSGRIFNVTRQHVPTMNEPDDRTMEGEYVSVLASQIWLIDIRNGNTFVTIPISQ